MAESRQNKQNRPQDVVVTGEETPSPLYGIVAGGIFLALNLFVAAIYFHIINP
jgi:hypothetical protein